MVTSLRSKWAAGKAAAHARQLKLSEWVLYPKGQEDSARGFNPGESVSQRSPS
jgi:hypothetical protein